jgi:putative pre-16S rRNA nuclease
MGCGRVLAVDYGSRNVGIACSDEMRMTVTPLPSLRYVSRAQLIQTLKAKIVEAGIGELVIGVPYNMDGSSGPAVQRIERFVNELRGVLAIPLNKTDERLSTIEALEVWNGMSPKQRRKYRTVDSLAAALILERYLDI